MKKIISAITLLVVVLFTGCGSSQPDVPKVKTTKKYSIESISLKLNEKVKTDIKYHTEKELEQILIINVEMLLKDQGLLSEDKTMNTLKINTVYKRRFLGDETPAPTDSLAYPSMNYSVDVSDNLKVLTRVKQTDVTYKGGFTMNLQVMAGTLRDKKYELEFIGAFAHKIVSDIEKL